MFVLAGTKFEHQDRWNEVSALFFLLLLTFHGTEYNTYNTKNTAYNSFKTYCTNNTYYTYNTLPSYLHILLCNTMYITTYKSRFNTNKKKLIKKKETLHYKYQRYRNTYIHTLLTFLIEAFQRQ